MGKKILAVVVALVAAQLLSGCYFLRELNWSKDNVPKGESTKATIGLQSTDEAKFDSYFFLIAVGEGAGFTFKSPVFDAEDVTGQRQKLIADSSIGDFIGDQCQLFAPPISGRGPVEAPIWRTENEVSSDTQKMIVAELKAKRDAPNQGGGFGGLVITGEWIDDGDGNIEDPETTDDVVQCTGESTTSFLLKGNDP
jgi:hypothetical protein